MATLSLVYLQDVFDGTAQRVQGAVLLLILGTGWVLTGRRKAREAQLRNSLHLTSATSQLLYDSPKGWPGVSMILPVKGCRDVSFKNWESQLNQNYGGELEILFVVDSKSDPAFKAVTTLAKSCEERMARVVVSGPSKLSSQKLHNIQTGIKAANGRHEFILCVDDDVLLHPSSLQDVMSSLQSLPNGFMATGYPFDLPACGSNLLTYAALSYHLPLLIAFSLQERTRFVWGGFMLIPLQELLQDRYDIVKAWADGGYSDDLIIAAKCGEHGLPVLCPSFAVFPQRHEKQYGWAQYWNYLRRQVYVMDTYSTPLNRQINHAMMLLHSYLSLAFTIPATTVALRFALWTLSLILLPTQKVYSGPGTSLRWLEHFGTDSCSWNSASAIFFILSLSYAAACLSWMSGVILQLFGVLSPELELSGFGFNWAKLWLGFYLNNLLIPPCMLYTYFKRSVIWSGVEYSKLGGKITKIRRVA